MSYEPCRSSRREEASMPLTAPRVCFVSETHTLATRHPKAFRPTSETSILLFPVSLVVPDLPFLALPGFG